MFLSYLIKYKWVLGVISAIASLYAIAEYLDQRGYNRAVAEIQSVANEEIAKATEKAIIKATKKNQQALDDQQLIFDAEITRVEKERIVEIEIKEVIKYVDKIEIKDECITISDDIFRMLNKSVNISNVTSN